MNLLNSFRFPVIYLALIASLNAHAYPGESIVLDPSSGDYIITYWDEEEPAGLEKGTFIPATKINPSVQSRFRMDEKGVVIYRYKVRSDNFSRQIIGTVRFEFPQSLIGVQDWPKTNREMVTEAQLAAVYDANSAALASPHGWSGGIFSRSGYRISWNSSPDPDTGIRPGSTVGGYGFSSLSLPGVGFAQLEGDHPPRGWSGPGPTEQSAIKSQLKQLEDNDFVSRNAAVPTVVVPVPFDAAILINNIRSHVATWPGKQLIDPAFATQLDRYMAAAADAFRLNNTKAGKEQIESLRKMLDREHKYLDHDDEDNDDTLEHKHATRLTIDRLAARVLDFDLRYVLKRTERGHEHEHGDGDRRKEQGRK
ncbi:MAG: hypothetical protein WAW02_03040 [Sideroxyarcus sp.]